VEIKSLFLLTWVDNSALYPGGHGFKSRPADKACCRRTKHCTSTSMAWDAESLFKWIINHSHIFLLREYCSFILTYYSLPKDCPRSPFIILTIPFSRRGFADEASDKQRWAGRHGRSVMPYFKKMYQHLLGNRHRTVESWPVSTKDKEVKV
jgi:hypothetical protein